MNGGQSNGGKVSGFSGLSGLKGRLRGHTGKVLAAGGAMVLLLGGGAYALIGQGPDADVPREVVRAAPATSSTTKPLPSSTTVASTSTTTTTEVPVTTTVAPDPPKPSGSVRELQQRLADLGYDVGTVDGFAGAQTYYSIMAFQKVEGLERTGEDSDALRAALATASKPGPMVPGGESNRVEIDLNRQVLFLWRGGALARILPVSTGSGEYYCTDEGGCDTAITPTGSFRIGRKAAGLEISPLGELWSPSYFYGGIALHGSPSIPPYPASHGCVRVPMYAHASLFDQTPSGMAVYVVGDGPAASSIPPPPDEPIKPAEPAPPPSDDVPTTTTTVPPVTETPETTTTTVAPSSSSTSTPPLTTP